MQKTFEVLVVKYIIQLLNKVFLQTFCFMTAGAGGPGTVYLEQSGLGVGSLLIDARGTDPLIKMTSQCREFDIQESGSVSSLLCINCSHAFSKMHKFYRSLLQIKY